MTDISCNKTWHYYSHLNAKTDSNQSRISPVNAVPLSGQVGTLQQKRRGLELSAEPSIPAVNTVPHGGQVESL